MTFRQYQGTVFTVLSFFLILSNTSFAASIDLSGGQGLQVDPDTSNCFVTRLDEVGCDDAACEAIVVGMDAWCGSVNWDGICVGEAWDYCDLTSTDGENARFRVSKTFQDGNTASVSVTRTCNAGLPLQQSIEISEGRGVEFLLTSFVSGVPTCTVVEETPPGYSAWYTGGDNAPNPDGCVFSNVEQGSIQLCDIVNTVEPVTVTVAANWLVGDFDSDVPQMASASMSCDNVAGGSSYWEWDIDGDTSYPADVLPKSDGSTVCTVSYSAEASAVESSGCEEPITVNVGDAEAGCTIEFSVFFEGIPTVNSYGMAILALLMLGIGFIGFRRFA